MHTKETQKINEAIEDFLVTLAIIIQTIAEINANIGDSAKNVPAVVAAPFPPLNCSQIGKTWPIIQLEHIYKYIWLAWKNFNPMYATKVPFKASDSSVMRASFLLPVLNTLVVPILCEPIFLISIPARFLVYKYPNGMDPMR